MSDDVGSLLLRAGMIATQPLEEARKIAKKIGGTVPEQLVRMGELDDEELTRFYCRQLLIPRINPSQLAKLSTRLIEKLPADMAGEFRSIPALLDTDGNLTIVMSDPSDTKAADEIGFFTGSYIVRAIATQAQIAWCLAHYYKQVTPFHQELIAEGQWPDDQEKPKSVKSGQSDQGDSDESSTGPLAKQKRDKKIGTARRRSQRRAAVPKRPTNQQPSPPELIARAGEIISNPKRARRLSMQPAVVIKAEPPQSIVISLDTDNDAIPREIQKGTDTSPFLLSSDTLKVSAKDRSEPILLGPKGKTIRRPARNTFAGVGAVGGDKSGNPWETALAEHTGTRDPLRDTIQMKPVFTEESNDDSKAEANDDEKTNPEKFVIKLPKEPLEDSGRVQLNRVVDMVGDDDWGLPGDTIPPAFLGATPETYDNIAESIPVELGEQVTIQMSMGELGTAPLETPLPQVAEGDLPGAAVQSSSVPTETSAELSAGIASKVLGSLRIIDRAENKGDVVEALLDFLDLAFARSGFLTLRNQELSPWRLHGAPDEANPKLALEKGSTFAELVQMRLPYSGTIKDDSARQLAEELDYTDASNLLALPITVKGRVLGVLFGLSKNDRLFEEHVAVLAEAASEAFERIILASR